MGLFVRGTQDFLNVFVGISANIVLAGHGGCRGDHTPKRTRWKERTSRAGKGCWVGTRYPVPSLAPSPLEGVPREGG